MDDLEIKEYETPIIEEDNENIIAVLSPEGILLSVVLDKNGYITDFTTGGIQDNETLHFYTNIPDDFYTLYKAYRVENETLVLDTKAVNGVMDDNEIQNLRSRREYECFSIINRGKLWYDRLTDEQYKELSEWYDAWLNVTERKRGVKGNIPEKPRWLE